MLNKLNQIGSFLIVAAIALFAFKATAQTAESITSLTISEQYEDAGKAFQTLLTSQPNNGDVYFYYGENYLHEYFSDTVYGSEAAAAKDALTLFKKGVEMDPANPLCYVGMGKVAMMLGDTAAARKDFNDAKSKFPSKQNKTSTISAEKQAITLAKMAEAYILIDKKKSIAKALPLLEKAVELDTKNPQIYLIYGDAYIENNDGSNAISQYKMAQELAPKSPAAKLRLGNLWIRAKNYTEAIGYYKEGITIDSTFAPAYLELGKLYAKASQLDKSLFYFKKYDEMSTNISAKIKYVNVLMESKKYEEALNKLNEISKSDTSRNDLNRAFAICYFETAKFDKALQASEHFFKKATTDKIKIVDYSYYGKALSKNNKDSLAIEKFKAAYKMDTLNYDILSDIAASYNKMKKYKDAAVYYELKISKPTEKSKVADYYKLGLVYYNIGKTDKSGETWKKADTTFAFITNSKPDFMNGKSYFYRGIINSNIDSASVTWQARPFYQKYVEQVGKDTLKFANDLIICYDYLASYYFLGPDKKICDARHYWEKIVALDPKNERALGLLKETQGAKCP